MDLPGGNSCQWGSQIHCLNSLVSLLPATCQPLRHCDWAGISHWVPLRPGQLHRPLSPCPWPERRVGAKSQHGKPHALHSLIEPPAAHITRNYVPCAWGFTPKFWYWSETVSKFSENCWYHNLVWSTEDTLGSLLRHVINQCVYLNLPPFPQ